MIWMHIIDVIGSVAGNFLLLEGAGSFFCKMFVLTMAGQTARTLERCSTGRQGQTDDEGDVLESNVKISNVACV